MGKLLESLNELDKMVEAARKCKFIDDEAREEVGSWACCNYEAVGALVRVAMAAEALIEGWHGLTNHNNLCLALSELEKELEGS